MYKIIHDAIHGSIRFEGVTLRLLETPELQRMSGIKQLGLGYLVFPGANHTRLEHSIGVSYMAGEMAKHLGLDPHEVTLVKIAGLLHDIGHSPYSHTLEYVLHEKLGKDHMEITADIIRGKIDIIGDCVEERERIHEIISDEGFSPDRIANIILGKEVSPDLWSVEKGQMFFGGSKNYLTQIINGYLDADQMDYLLRDAHYTGVAHGIVDVHRILNTIRIYNGNLVVDKKGVNALEGILVARALMYSSVYFHKTARIAEVMLSKAVEYLDMDNWLDIYKMADADLISTLMNTGGYPKEIALRIKYRKLFKKALVIGFNELTDELIENLKELDDLKKRRSVERSIANAVGIDEGYVLIDMPEQIASLSEPRLGKTRIPIVDGNSVQYLTKYSPLAKALQTRRIHDWVLMVSTPKKYVEKVEKAAKRELNL